jgi:hypothetical protein
MFPGAFHICDVQEPLAYIMPSIPPIPPPETGLARVSELKK